MDHENPSKKSKHEEDRSNGESKKMKGVVVLMKKKLLGVNDITASVIDRLDEFRGRKVALQLITTTKTLDSGMCFQLWIMKK